MRRGLLIFALAACSSSKDPVVPPPPGPPAGPNPYGIALRDVTVDAMGGFIQTGLSRNPIVVGNGAGIGDLDGDGAPDVVLARISRADRPSGGPSALMWNKSTPGAIKFENDAAFAALTTNVQAYGVAIGDYDRDGRLDIFLSCQGPDHLFHNEGGGVFADVTAIAGVAGINTDFSGSGVWVDANDDGLPDLYVSNYIGDTVREDLCNDPNTHNRLYLNLGDGTFVDVASESGVLQCGATFTTAAADLDGDGTLELYLANDTFDVNFEPSHNSLPKDALFARTSVRDDGVPIYENQAAARMIQDRRSTMGVGLADFDADGFLDVYLSNVGGKQLYLWRPETRTYEEAAMRFGLATGERDGYALVSWALMPIDLDRDRALEVFVMHGTLSYNPTFAGPERLAQISTYYRQPAPGMPFADITGEVGLPYEITDGEDDLPHSARGAYYADFDADGDLDVLASAFNEPFRVYENQTVSDPSRGYVRVRLRGTVSAPDPLGAVISVALESGETIRRQRVAGGLSFGGADFVEELALGREKVERVLVSWPSGQVDELGAIAAGEERVAVESAWMTLSSRVAGAGDPDVILSLERTIGSTVAISRSDGVPVKVDGFSAALPHPGVARRTRISIRADGRELPIHPVIDYR